MKFVAWASLKPEPHQQVKVEVESRAVGGAVVRACQSFDKQHGRGGYRLIALLLDEEPWAADRLVWAACRPPRPICLSSLVYLQTTQTDLKSRAALILNGYELGAEFLAFWTFTFRKTIPLDEARKYWNTALTHLRKEFGKSLVGLRAFELHPGGHGLHVHVVTPLYVRVERVRAALARIRGTPFGRIDVQPGDAHAGHYLAKYIAKSRRPPCFKGMRLWAALDTKTFNYTRVCDVIVKTLFSECWRAAKRAWNWTGNKGFFDRFRVVHRLVQLTVVSGCEPGKWPGGDYDISDPSFSCWFNSIPLSA